jgi:hypothetical protein
LEVPGLDARGADIRALVVPGMAVTPNGGDRVVLAAPIRVHGICSKRQQFGEPLRFIGFEPGIRKVCRQVRARRSWQFNVKPVRLHAA